MTDDRLWGLWMGKRRHSERSSLTMWEYVLSGEWTRVCGPRRLGPLFKSVRCSLQVAMNVRTPVGPWGQINSGVHSLDLGTVNFILPQVDSDSSITLINLPAILIWLNISADIQPPGCPRPQPKFNHFTFHLVYLKRSDFTCCINSQTQSFKRKRIGFRISPRWLHASVFVELSPWFGCYLHM